jgi:predicted PurR-regulated permease PerM
MTNQSEVRLASDTIYYLLFIGIGLFLVWRLSDIIILMVTAMMCAAALTPPVDWLHKEKLPRPLAAALVVIALVLPIVYVFIAVAPTFITQLPTIMQTVSNSLNTYSFLPAELRNLNFAQYFQNNTNYLWESTSKVTNFFFQVFTLVVMIFYLLVDSDRLHNLASSLVPQRNRKKVETIISELGRISGRYIRGNLLISVICTTIIFSGLLLLKIPYPVPLALFAGILDLLPMAGGTIGAIPAVVIAFTISPLTGLLTILLFVVYQQTENAILAPNIYKEVLHLIPFLSFVAVIIGSLLFGVAGAFLALPVAAAIPTILTYFKKNPKSLA